MLINEQIIGKVFIICWDFRKGKEMGTEKMDRRIRRTRRMLKQGLAELMREKEFKDITVKDITDRMDLNRGTFYLHYVDTYDLLEKLENETLSDFQTMIDEHLSLTGKSSLRPVIEPIASYIVENADFCKILFENKASNDFVRKFTELIYQNGEAFIRERLPEASSLAVDYCFSFISFGLIGLIKQWFDTGMEASQGELVSLADKLIMGATSALIA